MSTIPKAYDPRAVEPKWYDFWLKQGCFTADPARVGPGRPAYSIVIPPPNVTGMLHMGHVLNNTIQDILARKARMDGKEVLWLPGTDHAGIATQVQVEKALLRQEGKTRYDLGRKEFLKRVWAWKEKHGGIIIQQLKKLGCSCDWTRERFTLDQEYSRCVQKAFVHLYRKGLIYRGKRMVNWCPASLTALSDEEVEMKPQKGALYYFRVLVVEPDGTPWRPESPPAVAAAAAATVLPEGAFPGPEQDAEGRTWLTIATTRPETIPGDTAVAVHPRDPRYAHLIGRHVLRPLAPELPPEQRIMPIVGDEHVEFEFGTGVLKVTPAHDKADFEIGQRHGLPAVDIMNPDGTMNALAGKGLAGLDRFEARRVAVEQLRQTGAFVREEPYEHNVGFSQRAGVPIEPRLSEQWFLRYPAVQQARDCVLPPAETGTAQSGEPPPGRMRFHPDRWVKTYHHWLDNLQDWCISRQLWWGHRIPVWYRKGTGGDGRPPEMYCGLEPPPDPENWEQDPDVLDTWFSSWLWPFATMGWTGDPEQDSRNPTLQTFYPTSDLVTGPDIIFFWVARMIMAGYEFMGELPFRNVYFTGIIRDKQGRKMSKTLGNSPDPLDLIAKYGADALRFGTMRSAPLGQDVLFDEKDVELGRNFCNKLWNACRFRQLQQGELQAPIRPKWLSGDDRWILLRLDHAVRELDTAFAGYRFNEATATLYRFFWSEFCDWYLEAAKAALYGQDPDRKANTLAVLDFLLAHILRLFHPFLPFITEELWQSMGFGRGLAPDQGGITIMNARWPKPLDEDFKARYGLNQAAAELAEAKYELVSRGRNLRRELNLPPSRKLDFVLRPAGRLDPHEVEVIRLLLNAGSLRLDGDWQPPRGTPAVLSPKLGELYLPLEGVIDPAQEAARLRRELEKIQGEAGKLEQRLADPRFAERAPARVIEEHRSRLAELQARRERIGGILASLEG